MEWKQVPVRLKRFAEQSLRAFAQLHHGKICRRVQRNFSLAGVGFALSHIHGFGDQIDVLPAKSPDLEMHAEILTYSRSRCVFAGVSLEGAVVAPDRKADKALYGSGVSRETVVNGRSRYPNRPVNW